MDTEQKEMELEIIELEEEEIVPVITKKTFVKSKTKNKKNEDLTFIIPDIDATKIEKDYKIMDEIVNTSKKIEQLHISNSYTNIDIKKKRNINQFITFSQSGENFYIPMKDLSGKEYPKTTNIPCFYDRHNFSTVPLGIPIKYHYSEFHSYITSDDYESIKKGDNINTLQYIKDERQMEKYLKLEKEEKGKIYHKDIFDCTGIFCSFNCMISYITEYNTSGIYKESSWLLPIMFKKMFPKKNIIDYTKIPRSHPWQLLKTYGGMEEIEDYRKNTTVIENTYQFMNYKPEIFIEKIDNNK